MQTVLANLEIPLQLFFYDLTSAVLYAANSEFSSNACRKLMTRTIKYRQDGFRVKLVLNLTNKLRMVETEFDSRIDV